MRRFENFSPTLPIAIYKCGLKSYLRDIYITKQQSERVMVELVFTVVGI